LLAVLGQECYTELTTGKEAGRMLGENIKNYRKKKGYTQEEVADRLHVTRQTISKWEKNYSVPDAELIVQLAEILDVKTSQLLGTQEEQSAGNEPEKRDAYAEQLAHIAEQMAVRNRRSKRIWKALVIVLAAIVAGSVLLTILSVGAFSVLHTTETQQAYVTEIP
jgi:putative transcriptional regulator